jgi:hypothetical protein
VSLVALLGPQRFTPTLGEAVRASGVTGRLASITAGWQEREEEDLELHEHLGERTVNLRLYARAEEVAGEDPDLFTAHRERQERLRSQQALYRRRLGPMREAARRLLDAQGDEELLAPEREDAIRALARLDAHHLRRVRTIDAEFARTWRPWSRPSVRRQVEAIERQLEGVEAVAIAGGHVAVLLNRLRQFGIRRLLGARTLFAWSAGAMALAERIVLFHDSPPQGEGVTEVLQAGLGRVRGIVPLPHARRRLRLDDRRRVALHARRFGPDLSLAFDDGARLLLRDGRPTGETVGVSRLTEDGSVVEWGLA